MSQRQFILDNLQFRLASSHPGCSVNVGEGNVYGKLVVIHYAHTIPERDGTTGALKRFGLLEETYRVPSEIIAGASQDENRLVLRELLEILRPLLVVTSGQDATEMLKNKPLRSFKAQSGKEFNVADLTTSRFYAILNPEEYSYARAPAQLKDRGRTEWEGLTGLFEELLHQHQTNKWKV
jgi:hypothetical protein